MIKAIFFDIDDTLLDFAPSVREALKAGCEHFSIGEYKENYLDTFLEVTGSLWAKIEKGEVVYADIGKVRYNMIFERLGIDFDGEIFEKFYKKYMYDSAIPTEGAYEILDALQGKYILCGASNGPEGQQMNRLSNADMTRRFSYIFTSERLGATKPDPLFFEKAIDEINENNRKHGEKEILPHEVMIVGDSLTSDMAGGRAAGLVTCLFDRKGRGLPELNADPNIDHAVRALTDLKIILENIEKMRR